MIRSSHLALALLLVPLAACASTSTSGSALTDADVQSIRKVDEDWCRLAMAGDFAALVERCYTKDGILMPPNEPAAKGRAAIESSLRAWPRMTDVAIHADEVVGRGDLAYTSGTWVATMHVQGAAPAQDKGKFVAIWRKDADGGWKMTRDSYSSDLPAK